jgi:hypothetical protein
MRQPQAIDDPCQDDEDDYTDYDQFDEGLKE